MQYFYGPNGHGSNINTIPAMAWTTCYSICKYFVSGGSQKIAFNWCCARIMKRPVHPLHKPEFKDTYGSVHKVDLPNRNADNSLVEIPQCFDIDKRQFERTQSLFSSFQNIYAGSHVLHQYYIKDGDLQEVEFIRVLQLGMLIKEMTDIIFIHLIQ